MATTAQYVAQPTVDVAQIAALTANTARDGSGTLVTVASGPAVAPGAGVGKRINRVTVQRTGTSTNTNITFFYSPDGGTTNRFLCEVNLPAYTAATTTASVEVNVPQLIGFVIPGAASSIPCIRASCTVSNASPINVIVEGGVL